MERTLAIIKPDGVAKSYVGEIIRRIENENIRIVALRMEHLTKKKAEGFYFVHKGKHFFDTLIDFMTSGPVVLMVLEADNVIERWRNLMGATDPKKADRGTIRRDMGSFIEKNVTHGSDAEDTASFEVNYFFPPTDTFVIDLDKVMCSGSKE